MKEGIKLIKPSKKGFEEYKKKVKDEIAEINLINNIGTIVIYNFVSAFLIGVIGAIFDVYNICKDIVIFFAFCYIFAYIFIIIYLINNKPKLESDSVLFIKYKYNIEATNQKIIMENEARKEIEELK